MDGQTERCAHCGTPATEGRFCTNCGAELGTEPTNPRVWPAPGDTAERVYDAPAPAYAGVSVVPGQPPPAPSPAYLAPAPAPGEPRPSGGGLGPGVWIALASAMVLVLVLGGFLLFHGVGGSSHASSNPSLVVPTPHHTPSASAGSPSPSASSSAPSPSTQVEGPPTDVAGFAEVSAPDHAPAGVDFSGDPVSYVPANMVDGRNDTCWRTPGDATGTELTFRLDQPTRLSRVGLVNGYSKIAYAGGRVYDWYLGNRRVTSVEWIFDDGTTVSQTLAKNRGMQQIAIKPVTTRTVRLLIKGVTPPGHGRAARNDTAISEVLLLGRTAPG